MGSTPINNVSDTALWVAHFRAKETERPDALFHDPFAKVLVGEHGKAIVQGMKSMNFSTEWIMVGRTLIIDEYIQALVAEGIDTVINMGAGLDTRPYRLSLPSSLQWIEIDYPHMIAHKEAILQSETPRCQLSRIDFDLTNSKQRKEFLTQIAKQSQKTAIITEGVISYLKEEHVAELAKDLHHYLKSAYWIVECANSKTYQVFRTPKRRRKMKNAPWQFKPADWNGFFEQHGWTPREVRYLEEELLKHGRTAPLPWPHSLSKFFASKKDREEFRQMSGYVVYVNTPNEID